MTNEELERYIDIIAIRWFGYRRMKDMKRQAKSIDWPKFIEAWEQFESEKNQRIEEYNRKSFFQKLFGK